ncbi:acyl-CoA thioesterase [Nocardioides zeae]|uniref:Acyl-CoA thioesterase n=1 Tax=Nocardioides imazamoxiresistens TaxID=3231893 RepID=A0ABU3PTV5_9ACTN|nr:acyl-CoA thioesterase [Nocardioides zeae]MDT9592674.1 acyl-CoA thioesterase [Nocardioides zeae]
MTAVYDTEIQARLRDVNLAGHVDNVEAIRIVNEARTELLRFAPLVEGSARPGLLGVTPETVTDLVGGQRVDYHAEMRFAPFQPFLLRLWVSHVGRSSFTVAAQMRTQADHAPALVGEATVVLWDTGASRPWALDATTRATLGAYLGEPVAFRERRG